MFSGIENPAVQANQTLFGPSGPGAGRQQGAFPAAVGTGDADPVPWTNSQINVSESMTGTGESAVQPLEFQQWSGFRSFDSGRGRRYCPTIPKKFLHLRHSQ